MGTNFRFTRATIKALEPVPGKQTYVYDTDSDLALRVSPSGVKTFLLYRRVNGVPERITIGRFDEALPDSREVPKGIDFQTFLNTRPPLNVKMARALVQQVRAAIGRGENPNDKHRALRAEITFGGLFEKYMDDHIRALGKTERTLQSAWNRHLSPWAKRKLSAIHKADIQALKTKLIKAEMSAGGVNRLIGIVSALFGWAKEQDLYQGENPCIGVKKLKTESRSRFLQADELPRFFRAVADETNETARDYFLLSLLTGARKGNVLAMRWEEISFERSEWTIPKTKNGASHTVPLVPVALEILEARKNRSPWVFPGAGKTGHLVEPKKAWKRMLKRAELYGLVDALATVQGWDEQHIKAESQAANEDTALEKLRHQAAEAGLMAETFRMDDLHIHDLRRSMGSWQAATGASLSIIGKTLAHRNVSTTAIYARLNLDPVREAMNKAALAMFEAGEITPKADVVRLKK